jgi:hypothetical protein
MQHAILAAAIGVAAGYATGGRLRNLGSHPLRSWPFLAVGVLAQLFASDSVIVFFSFVCLLGFALRNLHLVGMGVVAIGLALNTVVIGLNGAMPVHPAALVKAGIAENMDMVDFVELGGKQRLEQPGDLLTGLGDIIPVRPFHQVLSFGDIIVAVGTADVIAHLMRRRRARLRTAAPSAAR